MDRESLIRHPRDLGLKRQVYRVLSEGFGVPYVRIRLLIGFGGQTQVHLRKTYKSNLIGVHTNTPGNVTPSSVFSFLSFSPMSSR